MKRFVSILLVSLFVADAAYAVSFREKDMEDRFNQLEEKVNQLQQGGGASTGADAASLQVQMDDLAKQMTSLRGELEEVNHRVVKLESSMTSLGQDVDFRLKALEASGASAAAGGPVVNMGAGTVPSAVTPAPATAAPIIAPTAQQPQTVTPAPVGATPVAAAATAVADATGQTFASSKEHYNYAFSLMNKARYEEAGSAFESFIKKYPSDPLVGNVYYWLGETWYVRTNYVKAADSFRQGFESMPKGNKAPDNLLKLAMALGQMKQQKQACVVLTQLLKKFPGPEVVRTRATREQEKQGCAKAS